MTKIKIHFVSSRRIHPKFLDLSVGKYLIEPIPDKDSGVVGISNRYLLRFDDEMRPGESMSQPETEGKLFLSYLSLLLGTQIKIESIMLNSVNPPTRDQVPLYKEFETVLDKMPDLNNQLLKFKSMENEVARQFLRASDVYRAAINLIAENNTLSFFLLAVAIECLSNKLGEGNGSCDKFIDFILKYLPDKSSLDSENDWREFLKEIYYRHRSGFTHGGKEVPEASNLADRLNRVYVRNTIDGKEVRSPGLKWFESVVRNTLIGFLMSIDDNIQNETDHFKNISLEYGAVMLKARKDLQAHSLVTEKDVQLD